MKAMVLAAGLGERMKPLTWNRAKPALPLLNRPSILHLLEHLALNGIDQIAINLHYRPETIRELEPRIRALGLRVHFSEEPAILGTAGGLKKVEEFLQGGTLVMVNSDFVTDCPVREVVRRHIASRALVTLVLFPFREGTEYGAVEMDGEGLIRRIAGRPGPDSGAPRYHFTGIHVIDPSVLSRIPPGVKYEINREVYPRLIEDGGRVMGYIHEGFWRELGTPARYLDGSLEMLRRGGTEYLQALFMREGVYSASPSSGLRGTAESPFLAGTGVSMEPDSFAAGAILGDGVKLARRSSLTRTVLWSGVDVGPEASLDECIVGAGTRIPPGTRIRRRIILDEPTYGGDRKGMERLGNLLVTAF